ncbi:MAG: radical SAM protein, partial [Elusimicrobiota bacterium]
TGDFVLLCYTRNTPYSYDAQTPVSVLALGTYLEERGVEVEYFDERIDGRARFDALAARGPRVVGFSVIGGYQIHSAARLARRARRISPDSALVWGGILPTTLPELTAREDYVDYVVLGEGEQVLFELYEALGRGAKAARRVKGTLSMADGELIRTAPAPLPDVEKLPFVYQGKAEWMLSRYENRESSRESVGFEASRGCPALCTFCYSPNFHNTARLKPPAQVARELDRLRELGVADLDIYDDTLFGGRREEFPTYLELLRERGFTWIGNLRINMLDGKMLRCIEDSGCKFIYYGIESNDDRVLRLVKKGITAEQVRAGVRLMREARIPAVYSLIYGMPIEGEKDKVGRILDFAEELHQGDPDAEIQVQSYLPLPGSDLYSEAIRFGFKPPERLEGWVRHDHWGIENPWLDDPKLANKVYISSFLAFRYRRHLSKTLLRFAAWPLHKLSLWRIRRRAFGLYFEGWLYALALVGTEFLAGVYFWAQNVLSYIRTPKAPPVGASGPVRKEKKSPCAESQAR